METILPTIIVCSLIAMIVLIIALCWWLEQSGRTALEKSKNYVKSENFKSENQLKLESKQKGK